MKCNSTQLLILLTAAVLSIFAQGAALPKREIDEEIDDVLRAGVPHEKNGQSHDQNMDTSHVHSHDRYCHHSNPCGWAIYNQFTRQIEYYMRGSCVCPEDKQCMRAEQDVSVAAYVYRCR